MCWLFFFCGGGALCVCVCVCVCVWERERERDSVGMDKWKHYDDAVIHTYIYIILHIVRLYFWLFVITVMCFCVWVDTAISHNRMSKVFCILYIVVMEIVYCTQLFLLHRNLSQINTMRIIIYKNGKSAEPHEVVVEPHKFDEVRTAQAETQVIFHLWLPVLNRFSTSIRYKLIITQWSFHIVLDPSHTKTQVNGRHYSYRWFIIFVGYGKPLTTVTGTVVHSFGEVAIFPGTGVLPWHVLFLD